MVKMNNEVKISQLALILLLIVPGGKYLALPKILAEEVGRDSWLTVALSLLFDAVCLVFLLYALRRGNGRTIRDILENSVGKAASAVIFVLFALFLGVRIVGIYGSTYDLFVSTFGISANWIGYALPVGLVTTFVVSRGFRAVARLNQLLWPVILLSLAALLVPPASQIDVAEILPVAERGFGPVFRSVLFDGFWFSDYIFLYFVTDGVKIEKRVFLPVMSGFAVGAALTVAMNVLFIGLYGEMAQYTDLAMSKVSQFILSSATNGRLDWLCISIWTLSVFIKLIVFTFCLYRCLCFLFRVKEEKCNLYVCAAASVVGLLPLFVPAETVNEFASTYLTYPFLVVRYALPLLMPLLTRVACREKGKRTARRPLRREEAV